MSRKFFLLSKAFESLTWTSTASGSEPAEETCAHSQSPQGSQAPLENLQETLDFKLTLMDMNKNMSTMATLLQQLVQPGPSVLAQRAKSNKVPRKRELTASEKMHEHTQMPPAKAPKESVPSNDDNVSVHVSDIEYGDTDSEADPCHEDDNHSTFSLERRKKNCFLCPKAMKPHILRQKKINFWRACQCHLRLLRKRLQKLHHTWQISPTNGGVRNLLPKY